MLIQPKPGRPLIRLTPGVALHLQSHCLSFSQLLSSLTPSRNRRRLPWAPAATRGVTQTRPIMSLPYGSGTFNCSILVFSTLNSRSSPAIHGVMASNMSNSVRSRSYMSCDRWLLMFKTELPHHGDRIVCRRSPSLGFHASALKSAPCRRGAAGAEQRPLDFCRCCRCRRRVLVA